MASSHNDWTLSCQSHTEAVGDEQLHGLWCPQVVLQAPGVHVHVGLGRLGHDQDGGGRVRPGHVGAHILVKLCFQAVWLGRPRVAAM